MTQFSAALIIIGNEILSGRTQDSNAQWIAKKLGARGITLVEIRVVPDIEDKIVEAVNALRGGVDYVFTTGGIGPTHDDITAASMARAFGVTLEENAEARAILEKNYGAGNLNPARLKMAMIPAGARLIPNPVSGAPGFIIGNVHVMAGVPAIMQGMLEGALPGLKTGAVVLSNTLICALPESTIAAPLTALQARYPQVDIGSYPHYQPGRSSVGLVLRAADRALLREVTRELAQIIGGMDPEFKMELQVEI